MIDHYQRFLLLADGMGEPGLDWHTFLLLFGVGVAVVTGISRWLGASRWLAFFIPVAPLLVCTVFSFVTGAMAVGQGGAAPWWLLFGPLTLIALPVSAIIVFIIPKRHDKPSA